MQVSAKSDVGRVRSINEDSYAVRGLGGGALLAVICDGMGGAVGGHIASQTAVRLITEAVCAAYKEHRGSRSVKHLLVAALDNANARVFDLAEADGNLTGMGTTVVAAIITEGAACIAHAGDSRAYHYADGGLMQLTKDHSVVQAMVDAGQLTEEEARVHPRKNLITRVLGVAEPLDVDYCEEEMRPGDILLLCTDGLTDSVDLKRGVPLLMEHGGFATLTEDLVSLANRNGGQDNITVVAVEV